MKLTNCTQITLVNIKKEKVIWRKLKTNYMSAIFILMLHSIIRRNIVIHFIMISFHIRTCRGLHITDFVLLEDNIINIEVWRPRLGTTPLRVLPDDIRSERLLMTPPIYLVFNNLFIGIFHFLYHVPPYWLRFSYYFSLKAEKNKKS